MQARANAREKSRWNHTASVLAELMNGPRQRADKRPWNAEDLHPLSDPPLVTPVSPQELTRTLRAIWL